MNLLLHIKSLIAFQIIMLSKEARLLLKKDKEKKKTKVTHYMIAFVYSSRKWKLVYSDKKQTVVA